MSEPAPGRAEADAGALPLVLIVTGLSGAGRSTAINALEDMGYEALDNFPLGLIETLIEPSAASSRPIAIGVQTRTRGFSARALAETIERLRRRFAAGTRLVFLDCQDEALLRRYSETRRRHPLAPAETAAIGIERERDLLRDVRERADTVIDTTGFSPHELRAALAERFGLQRSAGLAVSVQSFSYKRGTPHEADMVLDCRFIRNPYWEPALRDLDGRDRAIQDYVEADPVQPAFFRQVSEMVETLLPAYKAEGKAYFCIALGCTGGQHRSVAMTELLSARIADLGWPVTVRHRELERRGRA